MPGRPDSPPPHLVLEFGDGSYLFKLGLGEIAELQTKCGAGLGAIFARVLRGRYAVDNGATFGVPTEADWTLADLLDTVRLALIGGNSGTVDEQPVTVNPARAKQLVETYVFPARPLGEAWTLATAILTALIVGYDGGADGADSEKKKVTPAGTDGSTTG